jgi:molecular chaperone DnaK
MGRAIGIDLGTTNSCAAVIEGNQPKIIMYRGGSYTIPSLFAIDEGGRMLVGHDAKKQAALNPQDTIFAPKRLIGRSFHSPQVEKIRQLFTYNMVEGKEGEVLIQVKEQTFDLRQISAQILRKIKEVAEEYLKEEVTNAVITVPAYFNDKQRQAVRQAGKLADLNVLRILNEPTAAALAYGLGKNLRQRLAVFDLGGGTFDISIIEIRDKVFEVVATGGDTFLGGIDFDDRVMGWVMEQFLGVSGIDLSYDRVAIQRLREASERAKISLSTVKETNIEVPFIARGPKGILNLDIRMGREVLEELTGDLVERTVTTCERIFEEAKMKAGDIDEVLLVGGQSRMPLVQRRVREWFAKEPCKGVHPDEAVAVGAAIMAHSLTQSASQKVTLLDVLPMPIGIAKVDQSFLPLFPKNCPIPHVRRLTLTNSKDGQKTIMLKIYQGDSDIAAENELLGTFVFSGIRSAPRGTVKVDVWLNIDSEGILSLSAKDKDSGESVDVHLKLKDKTTAPQINLNTESRGGEMMDLQAAEERQREAEARAKREAEKEPEEEVDAAEKSADFGPGSAPRQPERLAKPAVEKAAGRPAEPRSQPKAAAAARPAPVAASGKSADASQRKGKGILVQSPGGAGGAPGPSAAAGVASRPGAASPAAPPPAAAARVASAPGSAAPISTTAATGPGSAVPVAAPAAAAPAKQEEQGCLSLLLPWNWFK